MVALVLVGHSSQLLDGLRAMLAQAAPGVRVRVAGGTGGGALGTSAPAILAALREVLVDARDGVVVMLDLGSAAMALEMALDDLPPGGPGARARQPGLARRGCRSGRRGGGRGWLAGGRHGGLRDPGLA